MDINDNSSIIQKIINIFDKNLEIDDKSKVRGVYDLLAEKDKKEEYNLKNIVENIFESDENCDDKKKSDNSTKETTQNNSSSNPNYNNNDQFGSSDQNEKPSSFKHSSQENLKKKYCDIADEIFEIISSLDLDEKKIEDVLTEVKNHFNNNKNQI